MAFRLAKFKLFASPVSSQVRQVLLLSRFLLFGEGLQQSSRPCNSMISRRACKEGVILSRKLHKHEDMGMERQVEEEEGDLMQF